MTPTIQLTTAQLEHATTNLEARVNAKKLEIHALGQFRDNLATVLLWIAEDSAASKKRQTIVVANGIVNYFTAKVNSAAIDLEELEMRLAGLRQMGNRVQVPGFKAG